MLNQPSESPGKPVTRAPVFFRGTVAMLALLVLGGVAAAVWLAFNARSINGSGGWGWLMAGAAYVLATILVCAACIISTAVSLFRREPHRGVSIAILVISCLIVVPSLPLIFRIVRELPRSQHAATRAGVRTPRPPPVAPPAAAKPPPVDEGASAPVRRVVERPPLTELQSKIWEAIRNHNAGAMVDCFQVEKRFDTPAVRAEIRKQVEFLMKGETIEVYFQEIPARELAEIMKIQQGGSASSVRYSLDPRLMVRIQQTAVNGSAGRSFLVGELNGKWYIVTLGGHVT